MRVYQSMLADADKKGDLIDFNRQHPDALQWVRDDRTVRGAFSRNGYDAMQVAIKNPARYAQGEAWVLGNKSIPLPDLPTLSTHLGSRYQADYIAAWSAFVQNAKVAHCASLEDASTELDALSGPTSPILTLIFTISHNTAVPDETISKIFQPAAVVVDPNSKERYLGPGIDSYLPTLAVFKGAVDQAKLNPNIRKDAVSFQPLLTAASTAGAAITPISLKFFVDPDRTRRTESTIKDRLMDPIQCVVDLQPKEGAGANAAGQAICDKVRPLLGKFPFSANTSAPRASLADVDAAFAPAKAALFTNFGDLKDVLTQANGHYILAPTAPAKTNPKFPPYYERLAQISSTLYASGAPSASFKFSLRFIPGAGVSNATLVVDGQQMAAGTTNQEFVWNAATAGKTTLVYDGNEAFSFTGTWSLFEMVRSAKITPTLTGYRLDYPITTAIAGHIIQTGKIATFGLTGDGAALLAGSATRDINCVSPVVLP